METHPFNFIMALQGKPQLKKLFQREFVRTIQIASAVSLAVAYGLKKRMDIRMEEVKKYLWYKL